MKTLNKYGVCCDPEIINVYYKDKLNYIQIKIAQTCKGWAVGFDIAEHFSGTCFPCTINSAKSREDAINRALDVIRQTDIVQDNPDYQKKIKQFNAQRIQLTLF